MAHFSSRHGFDSRDAADATPIRHEAPPELRSVVIDVFYECYTGPRELGDVLQRTLRLRAPEYGWKDEGIRNHVDGCQWFEVYDLVEAMYGALRERDQRYSSNYAPQFHRQLNDYFARRSIAWCLNEDGLLEASGSVAFDHALHEAKTVLDARGFVTARRELAESMRDLSRRPTADLTGSVQHAAAALECVARELTGDRNSTLGQLLARHRTLVPAPLDVAVEKLWGFASERGRHLREDRGQPIQEDVELIIHVIAALVQYLARLPPTAGDKGVRS